MPLPTLAELCDRYTNGCCYPNDAEYRLATILGFCALIQQGGGTVTPSTRYDFELLCDPVSNNPVFVRFAYLTDGTQLPVAAFLPNGAVYAGNISALVACGNQETPVDFDIEQAEVCNNGITLLRVTTYLNGVAQPPVYLDGSNNVVVPVGVISVGACALPSVSVLERPICDNGVTKLVQLCYSGCALTSVTYLDLSGAVVAAPVDFSLVTYGACERPELDVNYTGYAHICVTNGATRTNYIVRQRSVANNQTGLDTLVTEYSLDGTTWTTVAPVGVISLGACSDAVLPELDVVYSSSLQICVDNAGVSTAYAVRQRSLVDNQTGLETITTEYSVDGVTWTPVPPIGVITLGNCNEVELDVQLTAPVNICVDNAGVRTNWLVRQRTLVDNDTGAVTITNEYSLDGTAWSVIAPVGAVSLGLCSDAIDNELAILCDVGATTNQFLRRYVTTNGVVTTIDTLLDGITPYVVTGVVEQCVQRVDLDRGDDCNTPVFVQECRPELDVVYSDTGIVCFDDNGTRDSYFVRQRSVVDNQTGNETVTIEYSLDGATWSTTTPAGIPLPGECIDSELDVVYSDAGVVCFDNQGVRTQYFVRQRSLIDNTNGGETTQIEYSVNGAVWTTVVPPGNPTVGECAQRELDVVYSDIAEICVTAANGTRTSYLTRQRSVVDNTDASETITTEYSLDGVTWTTTAPTGSITLGRCSDRCVPLSELPVLTATPATFNPSGITLPYSTRTADASGFSRLVRDGCWSVPINTNLTGPNGTADMRYISGQLNLAAPPDTCVDINNSTVTISVDVTLDALVNLNPNPGDNDIYLWFGPTGGPLGAGVFSTVDVSAIGVGNTVTLSITVPANTINIPVNRLVLWMEPRDTITPPLPQYIGTTFTNLNFTPNYDTDDCEVDAERVTVCNAIELTRGNDCSDAIVVRTCNETLLWKECLEYVSIGELAPSNNYNILQFGAANQIQVHNVVDGVFASTFPAINLNPAIPSAPVLGVPSFDGNEFIFVAAGQVYRYTRAASGGVSNLISVAPITGIADTSGPPTPVINVISVHPVTGDIIALAWNTSNDPARLYRLNPVTGVLSYLTDIAAFPAGPVAQLDFIVTPDNRVFIIRQGQAILTEVGFSNGETVRTYTLPAPATTLSTGRSGTLLIGLGGSTQEYNVLTGVSTPVLPFIIAGGGEQELRGGWKAQSLGRENVVRFTRAYLKNVACDTVLTQDHVLDTGLPITIPSTAVLKPCNLDTREISWTQCLEYLPPAATLVGVLALNNSGTLSNSGGSCPSIPGFVSSGGPNHSSFTHSRDSNTLYALDNGLLRRFDWVNKALPTPVTGVLISGLPPGRVPIDIRTRWTDDALWLMVSTPVTNQVEFYTVNPVTAVATYVGVTTLPGGNAHFTWTTDNRLVVSYEPTPGNYTLSVLDSVTFALGATVITNAAIPPVPSPVISINTSVVGAGNIVVTTQGPPGPNLITFVRNDGTIFGQCGPHTGNTDTLNAPSGAFFGLPQRFTRVSIKDLVTDLVRVQDHDAITGLEIVLPVGARVGLCDTLQIAASDTEPSFNLERGNDCSLPLVTTLCEGQVCTDPIFVNVANERRELFHYRNNTIGLYTNHSLGFLGGGGYPIGLAAGSVGIACAHSGLNVTSSPVPLSGWVPAPPFLLSAYLYCGIETNNGNPPGTNLTVGVYSGSGFSNGIPLFTQAIAAGGPPTHTFTTFVQNLQGSDVVTGLNSTQSVIYFPVTGNIYNCTRIVARLNGGAPAPALTGNPISAGGPIVHNWVFPNNFQAGVNFIDLEETWEDFLNQGRPTIVTNRRIAINFTDSFGTCTNVYRITDCQGNVRWENLNGSPYTPTGDEVLGACEAACCDEELTVLQGISSTLTQISTNTSNTSRGGSCSDPQHVRLCLPNVVNIAESVNAGNNVSIPAGRKSVTIRKNNAAGIVNINLPGGPFELTENQSSITIEVRKDDYFSYSNYQLPAINITSTTGGQWSWVSVG